MTADRKPMQRALRSVVVPKLRELGFSGSLPHFRRQRGDEHLLVMLVFNKYGGSFYLEAGRMTQGEFEEARDAWAKAGKSFEASRLTVADCAPSARARLGGNRPDPGSNHWFFFGADDCEAVAARVVDAIQAQLEPFFDASRDGARAFGIDASQAGE